jgi:hypothetical protein
MRTHNASSGSWLDHHGALSLIYVLVVERKIERKKIRLEIEKNRAQEDPLRNIANGANSIGPKAPKSPMFIEHRPSHLN